MHDFRCTSAVDIFYQELATSVRHFKETEGGRSQIMKMTAEQAMSILKISDEDKVVLSKRF